MRAKPTFKQYVSIHTEDQVLFELKAKELGGKIFDVRYYENDMNLVCFKFKTMANRQIFKVWTGQSPEISK